MKRLQAFVCLFCLGLVGAPPGAAQPLVVFVAGDPSHGPGEHEFVPGCALLADALNTSGLDLRTAVSQGWPDDDLLADAQTLVLYSDGLEAHVARNHAAELRRHVESGRGIAVLHFALEAEPGELAETLLDVVGGRFEAGWSVNPVWKVVEPLLGEHEVARGVEPFDLEDEWYFHLRFRDGIVPVLQALPPLASLGEDGPRSGNPVVRAELERGQKQTLAWIYDTGTWRGFGFTGGHFHHNWTHEKLRRLVLNGVAWTAGIDLPASGITTSVAPIPRYATIDEAIARGDLQDVKRHVAAEPERMNRGRHATLGPLHQAILRNQSAIALYLLEVGADPNLTDSSMRTPLHLAVDRNNVAVAEALLAQDARPNERDNDGWTPLHHAAARDRLDVARALLAGGADPMTLSALGGTPLHEAAASGGREMIELLLAHGVDPSVVSKTGVTALDIAREYGNPAAIEILSSR